MENRVLIHTSLRSNVNLFDHQIHGKIVSYQQCILLGSGVLLPLHHRFQYLPNKPCIRYIPLVSNFFDAFQQDLRQAHINPGRDAMLRPSSLILELQLSNKIASLPPNVILFDPQRGDLKNSSSFQFNGFCRIYLVFILYSSASLMIRSLNLFCQSKSGLILCAS